MSGIVSRRRSGRAMMTAAACCIWLLGCGGGDDGGTDPPPDGDGSTDVGPAGGTAASADGRATVTVAAGTFDHTVTLTVVPATAAPAGALSGTTYDLGPSGTSFSLPVGLSLRYDPASVPTGTFAADLRLARASGQLWIPLADSRVDSLEHLLTATTTHFSTFGVTAGGGGELLRTAYLLDSVDPGADDQFTTLAAAVAWLASGLAYEGEGVIDWRTSRPQAVTSLAFLFDLRIEVAAGHTAIIEGPAAAALVIDAGGAVDLSDITIAAPGGLTLNANRSLALVGCALPDGSTLNIGGVKQAPFPAGDPGYVPKSAAAATRAKGATVRANSLGVGATVAFVGTPASGDFDISDNTGQDLLLTGPGGVGGTAIVTVSNPIPYPTFGLPLHDDSKLVVRASRQIVRARILSSVSGRPTVSLEGNEGGSLSAILSGTGALRICMSAHQINRNSFQLAVPSVTFEGQDVVADSLRAVVSGDALSWTQSGSVLAHGLELDASAVSGSVSFNSTGDVFRDATTIAVSPGAAPTVYLGRGTMNGARLLIGHLAPKGDAGLVAGRAAKGSLTLEDLTWDGDGTDHVEISALDVPVTVSGCSFSHSGDLGVILGLTEVGGSITVTDSQFQGAGIGLVDCTGSTMIADCGIDVTATTGYGISLGGCAGATIRDTHITSSGGLGLQTVDMGGAVAITGCTLDAATAALACFFAQATVNLDNNPLISGQVMLVASRVHMSGNTFSSAQVVDDWTAPGLQNDPVADNDGLAPGDVITRMDWDDNGCCDYPPELNVPDENGDCPCEGVGAK